MQAFRAGVWLAAFAAGLLVGHPAALAADAARGKILFTQKYGCYECHGTEGQGSPATGPRLARIFRPTSRVSPMPLPVPPCQGGGVQQLCRSRFCFGR